MSTQPVHSVPKSFYERFDRKDGDKLSTHYCPGCGHGLVHKYIAEALDDFGVRDRTVLVSPVGCSVFAYYYFDVGNIQSAHGRSSPGGLTVSNASSSRVNSSGDAVFAMHLSPFMAVSPNDYLWLHSAVSERNFSFFSVAGRKPLVDFSR